MIKSFCCWVCGVLAGVGIGAFVVAMVAVICEDKVSTSKPRRTPYYCGSYDQFSNGSTVRFKEDE